MAMNVTIYEDKVVMDKRYYEVLVRAEEELEAIRLEKAGFDDWANYPK